MNLTELALLFPNCTQFQVLPVRSGQKEVVSALQGPRRVAIKLFHRAADDQDRIDRELAACTKLQCHHVPKVIDSGHITFEGVDRVYLVEQFIEGETYGSILRQTPVQTMNGVLDLARVLLQVALDCEIAGLVHRDLKPENLIRDAHGQTWILDFGLVKHLDLSSLTPTGQGVGTLGYAPIEQMRLMKAEIDIRADLFAIGTIMYESFYGQNPWREGCRDNHDVVRKMGAQELQRLAITGDASGMLSAFIAWLAQRFPSRRPQSAAEALAAFELVDTAYRPQVP